MSIGIRAAALLAAVALGVTPATARARQVIRINDEDAERVLKRLEQDGDAFRKSVDDAAGKPEFKGQAADAFEELVKGFERATDALRAQFDAKRPSSADATEVLNRAVQVDLFLQRTPVTQRVQDDWARLRAGLDMLALVYRVEWNWDGAVASERLSDQQVEALLKRVETAADAFRSSLNRALDASAINGTSDEDVLNNYVRDFEQATDRWKRRFGDHNSAGSDATEVLRKAAGIDRFMRTHTLTAGTQSDWATLRGVLDEVAAGYGVAWIWDEK
jgi:hypothetical protein